MTMDIRRFGNIVFIPGSGGARYPHCNSLFIDDEVKAVIDPGSDEACLRDLAAGRRIDVLLDTHYHEDHTAFNHLFADAALWVHEAEAPCHRSYRTFLEHYGLAETPYRKEWDEFLIGKFHWRERTPARALKDGDILDFGRTRAEVIHTPGHTIGHICLHFADEGILFLADYDLTPFGPWYAGSDGDIDQFIASCRMIEEVEAEYFITGHEMGVLGREEFRAGMDRYLAGIDERDEKILSLLSSPLSLEEVARLALIYGRRFHVDAWVYMWEFITIKKHLQRLERQQRVSRIGDRFAAI